MLCYTPAHKDFIRISCKSLHLCQFNLGVLFYARYLCRCNFVAAVEVIGEGIGLQHIRCSVVILIIAPCGVNFLICRSKGNLSDRCRCVVRAAEN